MSLKTYTRFSLFALLVYLSIYSKQEVFADTNTTCAADLDIENERYVLTGNTIGDCVVTADGITIDGQDLYEVNGNIIADGTLDHPDGFDVSIEDVSVIGDVFARGYLGGYFPDGANGGDVVIENSSIGGDVKANGINSSQYNGGNGGSVTLSLSNVGGDVESRGGTAYGDVGGNGGDISISGSSVVGVVRSHGGDEAAASFAGSSGAILIDDSDTGNVYSMGGNGYKGNGDTGTITITDSETGSITSTGGSGSDSYNQSLGGDTGIISITDSDTDEITSSGGHGYQSGGHASDVSIIRSNTGAIVSNGGTAYSESYQAGNGGDVTIVDSNTGSVQNYGGVSAYGENGVDGNLSLTDNTPIITVDPEEMEIEFEEVFTATSTGVTADDAKDGDITEDIEVSGTVGAEAGEYELEYSVTDLGTSLLWNGVATSTESSTATSSRFVTRLAYVEPEPEPEPEPEVEEEEDRPKRNGSRRSSSRASVVASAPSAPSVAPVTPSSYVFTRNLTIADTGPDVLALQQFLNKNGFTLVLTGPGSPGNETSMFGGLTRAALARYQASKGIIPAVGYFGPITRASIQ